MKAKRIILASVALLLFCAVMLSSCNKDNETDEPEKTVYCTIKFNSNGGTPIEQKKAPLGGKVGEPSDPVRDGYVFDGWYYNNLEWLFHTETVRGDMTLTAKWIDAEQIFNYRANGDGTATITGVLNTRKLPSTVMLPSQIAGYTVTTIGESAFESLASEEEIKSITVPETVTKVGEGAFAGCKNIEIIFNGELSSIGEGAFDKCAKLKAISFGKELTKISAEAFRGTGITNLTIPQNVTAIDENAFEACNSLTTVILHSNMQTIGDSAFYETAIKAVYIYGTDEEAEALMARTTEFRNDKFLDAKIYLYSKTEPTSETQFDGFWFYDSSNNIELWR